MATEAINNNYQTTISAPAEPSTPPATSGSNVGSMAVAIFEIAATMTKLNNNNAEISIESTNFQNDFNEEQRSATIKEGNKQALGNWLEMGSSLFSATVSSVTLGADNLGEAGKLNDQLQEQNKQLGELEDFQGKVQDQMPKTREFELAEEGASAPARDPRTDDRIKEMQSGRITDPEMRKEEKMLMTPEEFKVSSNNNALAAAGTGELTDINNQTGNQIKNKYSDIEATNGKLQRKQSQNRMISDIVNQAGKSGFDAGKAIATEQAAHAKAAEQAAQFDQQIQEKAEQNAQKATASNLDYTNSALAALDKAGG
jgi:hypothetical protein